MKKTVCILVLTVLIGGLSIAGSVGNRVKEVDRNVYFNKEQIVFEGDALDVNGKTYVPLRELCENMGKKVTWESNADGENVVITDRPWGKDGWESPLHGEMVPDAETARVIADALFKHEYKDMYFVEAGEVRYDKEFEAWVVYKNILGSKNPNSAGSFDAIPLLVIKKSNGQIIARWAPRTWDGEL